MTPKQLQQYDLFLDENDWDIYYWVTQEPPQTSMETAEGGDPKFATKTVESNPPPDGGPISQPDRGRAREPAKGEWAQTVGTFKPAYRPVPQRWKNSEILSMMRKHVIDRSAGGVHVAGSEDTRPEIGDSTPQGLKGGGLGFMPELRTFDQ